MEPAQDVPTIPELFKGRSVFVTGFTGFMGKVLVEKLMWSCPDIKHIYVLLREKRGMALTERLKKIVNSDLYTRVREHRKDVLERVLIPIGGDVTLPGLGLSSEDRARLCQEVSIVFHGAASVKFDDPLTTAVNINVKGTKSVVDLALEMPHLVAFLHLSTAFSNCDRFEIEEKVYPPHADWNDTLKICEKIDVGTVNILGQKYTNHMPNTYVFAKSLGEHVVNDHGDRLPSAIFRPSIVVSTVIEPFPGWIDNFNGPIGMLFAFGTGVLRTSLTSTSIRLDFIPVDLAIRGLIVTAHARVHRKDEGVHVYNWCTQDRSVTNKDIADISLKLAREAPMKYQLWRPSASTTESPIVFFTYFVLFQMLPAFFIDLGLRLIGRKPMLWKIQRKVFIALNSLSYFSLNHFHFQNKNGYSIAKYILPEDEEAFNYIMKEEDIDVYSSFYNCTKYMQLKFLKQTEKDKDRAKMLYAVLTFSDYVVKSGFFLWLFWLVYKYEVIQTFTCKAMDFLFKL